MNQPYTPRTPNATSEDYVSLESVQSGKHTLLSSVSQQHTAFWVVRCRRNQVAFCSVRNDESGTPIRLSVAFRCRADRLPEIIQAIEAAATVLGT
jgi:hypothetical protein